MLEGCIEKASCKNTNAGRPSSLEKDIPANVEI